MRFLGRLGAGCVRRPVRLAALLLLLVWVGPVSFQQTDAWQLWRLAGAPQPAAAEPRVIPAGRAMTLDAGTPLVLHLKDGGVVQGRFLGRTLLDSALYVPRFAAYARSSAFVPLALGDTLRVTLRDGREWIAPFAGYGELTLLLRSPDGGRYLRVPFEFAKEIHRGNGDTVEPRALAGAFHQHLLPSAEALAVEGGQRLPGAENRWRNALEVAVDDVASATVELPSGVNVAGIVVLTVVLGVVVLFVILHFLLEESTHGCTVTSARSSALGARLTTRPFDRDRGCYVGDPLAVATEDSQDSGLSPRAWRPDSSARGGPAGS